MIALYQFIELSRAGLFAMVRRHGDVARLHSALRRRADDPGTMLPMGTMDLHPWWRWTGRQGPTMLDLLRSTGIDPNAWDEVFQSPVSGQALGVPAPGDLDDEGRCRCGCGYGRLDLNRGQSLEGWTLFESERSEG